MDEYKVVNAVVTFPVACFAVWLIGLPLDLSGLIVPILIVAVWVIAYKAVMRLWPEGEPDI